MIKNSLSWINLNASVGGGTGGTSDYNQLSNRPIKTLIGTAQNPIKLWKLETGLFILNGFIQHTNELVSEGKSLFVSVVAGLSNGKYVVAAFIPFWEGQYEYILNSLSSNNYNEHQIVMMISQDDVLTLDNEKEYTPTKDYHPSTKKYVDDMIVNFREELSEMGVNEENIESLMAENRRRDIAIQALLSQGGGSKTVTIEEETHTISLDYSIDKGMVTINTMEGSTLVNVATQKEKVGLSYGQDNTVNYSNEILTEQNTNVKPMLEGNTMVNYCNNGNISMGLNKEINVVDDTGKMITLDDTTDSGLVDVKIEGKTLVNLAPKYEINYNATDDYDGFMPLLQNSYGTQANSVGRVLVDIKPSTEYTVFFNVVKKEDSKYYNMNNANNNGAVFETNMAINSTGTYVFKVMSKSDLTKAYMVLRSQNSTSRGKIHIKDIVILEGDHTDKDISYFEGLKSVGQDSDEISVSSVKGDGNLIDETKLTLNTVVNEQGDFLANEKANLSDYIKVKNGDVFTVPSGLNSKFLGVALYNQNKNYIKSIPLGTPVDTPCTFTVDNDGYMRVTLWTTQPMMLFKGDKLKEYQSYQSNKKQVLYFNPTTQTWEKPILREWDSIEKHSDGKYYYHKRSEEVTLDGSENWAKGTNKQITQVFSCKFSQSSFTTPINDKFPVNVDGDAEKIAIADNTTGVAYIYYAVNKSKLSTQDVAGFKQWLQANPTTVVYQLAEEEVYECTNLSLDTYSNQTNIFNNSLIPCNMEIKNSTYDCILSPNTKYTVKLDSNISNDIQVNLGGTVSTINSNIFEITTPNELTNESLTLYGNGEIVNNVMLFHNQDDITTYEYFAGLKSCFEEELVTDENSSYYGKYRVKYDSGVDSRTFYLNSPLLKGDRIEEKDGKLYHYHNMGKAVLDGLTHYISSVSESSAVNQINTKWYQATPLQIASPKYNCGCIADNLVGYNGGQIWGSDKEGICIVQSAADSSLTRFQFRLNRDKFGSYTAEQINEWLQVNPVTVVYELAEPYYEEISSSQKLIKASSNNKLTFNTNIPLTSIQLKPYEEELTYLYKSTVYTVQFEADNNCLVNVTLGGTKLLNQSIVAGLNKIQITTPSTLLDNKLRLDVIGSCNISELVVTNSIQEFEYFEGMKSSFEDTPNDEVYNAEIIIYNAPVRFGKGGRL